MKIYLTRHPQTSGNASGIIEDPLSGNISSEGEWQAERFAKRVAELDIYRGISSDSKRCELLAKKVIEEIPNFIFSYNPQFRERNPGSYIGKPKSELEKLGIHGLPPGGESLLDLEKRAEIALESIPKNSDQLILSHGMFLRALLSQALKIPFEKVYETIKFSNTGITGLNFDGNYKLEFQNDRSHLGKTVKKIHIFGPYASGKSTLAQSLGDKFDIPVFELDDLKYERKFDLIRPLDERIRLLDEISSGKSWITEGSWGDYASLAFERADYLIFTDLNLFSTLRNGTARQVKRIGSNNNQNDGVINYIRQVFETINYYLADKPVSEANHQRIARDFAGKTLTINSLEGIEKLLDVRTPNELQFLV